MRLSASGRRVPRPAAAAERASDSRAPAPPPPPAVGWLWDRKASDTRKRLQEHNLRPKKSMGQNFMLDDAVLADIVAAADLAPGDAVLEIGPGTGNLTRHLLAAGALVTAVEKDEALSTQLEQEFAAVPALRLVCGDILRQDVPALLDGMAAHAAEWRQQHAQPQQPGAQQQQQQQQQQQGGPQAGAARARPRVRVVANLPYYITKQCLLQLLPEGAAVHSLLFMLQDEVGVRLTQREPGAADWRAMNLLTQYYSRPRYLFRIDRRKYLPPPKVHGAVVCFELLPPGERLHVPSEAGFLKLVNKAFSQRRKVVRNALRPWHEPGDVAAALAAAGLNEGARAQDLTLRQWGDLAWRLHEQGGGGGGGQAADAA